MGRKATLIANPLHLDKMLVCSTVLRKKKNPLTSLLDNVYDCHASHNPASLTTKLAACPAFSLYVRCGSRTRSPPRQMSSPVWQMIKTFEAGTLPTAWPLSGSPKIYLTSANFLREQAKREDLPRRS